MLKFIVLLLYKYSTILQNARHIHQDLCVSLQYHKILSVNIWKFISILHVNLDVRFSS
jgi:hypothetical protein